MDVAQLASDLEFVMLDKARVGSDILHRVNNAKTRGGVHMYAEAYKWFTETSGLGLAEQAAALMHPNQAKREADVATAVELWEEKLGRLARHGEAYQLATACKQVALKKILVGKIRETYELWETEKFPFRRPSP